MSSNPVEELGQYLSANEARKMAVLLVGGAHINKALNEVAEEKREVAKGLMASAALDHRNYQEAARVLLGIAGAKSAAQPATPVWTMPGNEAEIGHLTNQFHRVVSEARVSVTCATYNFETTSKMWDVLREASERPGVLVSVYVDGETADTTKVAQQLPKATVFRSGDTAAGKHIRSHAKFVVVDHELLLLTSANFSYSAENLNVEFGLLLHDPRLAASVEEVMRSKQDSIYVRMR
jgi:phosphatidylserine/phosphatidylglycerophosphate/cardiolipin synthase-like enzyme